MKNKIMIMLVLLFSIFYSISTVHAIYNGGSSGGIPASGGGSCGFNFTLCGNQAGKSTGYGNDFLAVRLRLVYYDGVNMAQVPGSRDYFVVRDYVVSNWSSDFNCNNRSDCETQPRDYNNWFDAGGYNSTRIENDICGGHDCPDEDRLNTWLRKMGVDREDLTQPSCGADGTGNCMYEAGYRILIEPVLHYRFYGHSYFNTLKAIANLANTNTYSNPNNWIDLNYLLHTDFDDVGITRANGKIWDGYQAQRVLGDFNSGYGYNIIDITNALPDTKYDYRPDSLCYNCDDTDKNWSYVYSDTANWAAIGYSLESDNSNLFNYFNQHKQINGNDVVCREEIRVKFPDTDNTIKVQTGRYFTVGLPQQYALNVPNFEPLRVERTKGCHAFNSNGDDVTTWISDSDWQNYWNGDDFYKKAQDEKNGKSNKNAEVSTGTITLDYNETYEDSRYSGEKATDVYNTQINLNRGNLTVTNSYKLATGTYRYIRKDNGLSVMKEPDVAYTEVGVDNLPVSFNNTIDEGNGKAGTLSFKYTIPSKSSLSKSIGHPDYFNGEETQDSNEDIYKIADQNGAIQYNSVSQGSLDNNQYNDLLHTACVLEYCDSNGQNCSSGFNACMIQKVMNGRTQDNCSSENYICDIGFQQNKCYHDTENGKYYYNHKEIDYDQYVNEYHCDSGDDDDCTTEADANRLGRDWNSKGKYCCPVGTTYNSSTGTCDSGGEKCRYDSSTGKYYFNNEEISYYEYVYEHDCDDITTNECYYDRSTGKYYYNNVEIDRDLYVNKYHCDGGTENVCYYDEDNDKYYLDGEEITKEQYLDNCPCTTSDGKYYINMQEVSKAEYEDVCPPNETICPPTDPCCYIDCDPPSGDGASLIYRTIDLNNPFPGYSDQKRKTGTNWCTYDPANRTLNCDGYKGGQNTVVQDVIFENRDVETVAAYSETPLYEFELDAAKIEKLRDYNSDHEYSDFTLKCEDDGTGCKLSSSVKSLLNSDGTFKGTCVNAKGNSFYTCDE